jgi:hypothetical protein
MHPRRGHLPLHRRLAGCLRLIGSTKQRTPHYREVAPFHLATPTKRHPVPTTVGAGGPTKLIKHGVDTGLRGHHVDLHG